MKRKKSKLKVYMTNIKADENYILVTDNHNNVEKMLNIEENFEKIKDEVCKQYNDIIYNVGKDRMIFSESFPVDWAILSFFAFLWIEKYKSFPTVTFIVAILTDSYLRKRYDDYCNDKLNILYDHASSLCDLSYEEWNKDGDILLPEEALKKQDNFFKYLVKRKQIKR